MDKNANIANFIRSLKKNPKFSDIIAYHRYIHPIKSSAGEIMLPAKLKNLLLEKGITKLWSHQVEGIQAVRRKQNVVIMTPTASGKTMIYNLPVIESILKDPQSRALYIFPLKGLEQDQVKELNQLFSNLKMQPPPIKRERKPLQAAEVYDGDTSPYQRRKIRDRLPNVIFTNPDMIHLAFSPYHAKWAEFFRNLKFIVIDEIHTYHGVFGSNTAHVFRRLRRICRFYGSDPVFIACSATIANPAELAKNLTGLAFKPVIKSGAPQGGKHFVFINPEKNSPYTQATWLFIECLKAGFKTIVFTKSRKITELIYNWTRERIPAYKHLISPYRSGFLPRERREIEKKLFQGTLRGVVSTSALELGIDIGGLDACILVGYPGSIASTWQRSGRVGRRGRDSLIFLVAANDALDKFFMRHPEKFFEESHESAVIDPENTHLLKRHLPCAAAELYLKYDDSVYDIQSLTPVLADLVREQKLNPGRDGNIWFSRNPRPHQDVSIRSIGEPFSIRLKNGDKIGEVDATRVYKEAFPGAVYLHRGETYRVIDLDIPEKTAFAQKTKAFYYTQHLGDKHTRIISEEKVKKFSSYRSSWGKLCMTEQTTGYVRKRIGSGEPIGRHPLQLPPEVFETEGLWFQIDSSLIDELEKHRFDLEGSLHGAEHAVIKTISLFAICEQNDIGGLSHPRFPEFRKPAIFVYDGCEGGIAFTERAFTNLKNWLQAACQIIKECPCESGCPSCVQDPMCGSANDPLNKDGAYFLLRGLLSQISNLKSQI